MTISIRTAVAADAPSIRRVHLAAFPTPVEADLVERLERDGEAVVSLLAEEESEAVGHLLLSRMRVEGDGRQWRALGLAPIAVLPERQRGGIGGALIREALIRAGTAGEELVFVLGEPDYYGRFGFSAAIAAPFASPYAGPYFQALALGGGEMPAGGFARYAPAFDELG